MWKTRSPRSSSEREREPKKKKTLKNHFQIKKKKKCKAIKVIWADGIIFNGRFVLRERTSGLATEIYFFFLKKWRHLIDFLFGHFPGNRLSKVHPQSIDGKIGQTRQREREKKRRSTSLTVQAQSRPTEKKQTKKKQKTKRKRCEKKEDTAEMGTSKQTNKENS